MTRRPTPVFIACALFLYVGVPGLFWAWVVALVLRAT